MKVKQQTTLAATFFAALMQFAFADTATTSVPGTTSPIQGLPDGQIIVAPAKAPDAAGSALVGRSVLIRNNSNFKVAVAQKGKSQELCPKPEEQPVAGPQPPCLENTTALDMDNGAIVLRTITKSDAIKFVILDKKKPGACEQDNCLIIQ